MDATSHRFRDNARHALANGRLKESLASFTKTFPEKRQKVIDRLPEFDALRDEGVRIKNHVLANLDFYLERFEAKATAAGAQIHWCRDAAEARETVLSICRAAGARTVTKSKSMIGEEIAINEFLESNGVRPVETDLGEYIIQVRGESPSHILVPAIHLKGPDIAQTFREKHTALPPGRALDEPEAILREARTVLRGEFLAADVGLTGANMLVAETGSIVVVTNEGNADLVMSLPKVHVAVASLEKVVPTLEDAATILRLLARSATGQDITAYTTFATGPKRPGDPDGPDEFHIVLLDNGRTAMLGGEFRDMLRCIRCGACLNHCPVYAGIGGHAYGWVYSGPMGSVLTPSLLGAHQADDLPNASTFCGKCEQVCPMRIPLPTMMRHLRERQFTTGGPAAKGRGALKVWAFFARRPALYRRATALAIGALAFLGGGRGRFRRLPLTSAWTGPRDLPAPQGRTFQALWAERRRRKP
ncbi:MAG: iron-sulfur cluster-binding protein [Rhodospirillales bacterium]|nr:iron-sulfur cluster-binding protein [Rhodospirillales bacterium]